MQRRTEYAPFQNYGLICGGEKMVKPYRCAALWVIFILTPLCAWPAQGQEPLPTVSVDWGKILRTSKTNATLQVVVNPLMRRGSSVHDRVFQNLRELGCDYVRYDPWLPYPRLAVAELEPPRNGKTSWDFSLLDPITEDVIQAAGDHSVIWNFSVIPQWMFVTPKPVAYPEDPNQATWAYQQGTEFRDPTLKELGDYYARIVGWYTQGGFTDEYGEWHKSGHHYKIEYWEALNEIELEHAMSPQTYTRVYDAMVNAIHKVSPQTKFVGMALTGPMSQPEFFEYFLDPKNHMPGIPIDMISYHFYSLNRGGESPEAQQYTFFEEADHFLDVVRYIQTIRQRLSPQTGTTVDELGTYLSDDLSQGEPGYVPKPIPVSYWNLSGAVFAYVYGGLATLGVEAAGESALAQLPMVFPSVTMMDWTTGQPNARYWVLKLLRENFGPGDKVVSTTVLPWAPSHVYAQAFITPQGKRKILFVNKSNGTLEVSLPSAHGGHEEYVDQTTGSQPPAPGQFDGDRLVLNGYRVAVVTLP
jgi:hypothetical protein